MPYCYNYPRPAVSSDCVIFGFDGFQLNVLLIERKNDPYKGYWAFPGGFLEMDETSEQCARRELEEETGITDACLEQLYTFSGLERDPRGRVVSVAYMALVRQSSIRPVAGDDALQAQWFPVNSLPKLAFDHDLIFRTAMQRLRQKFCYQPIGYELLGEKFTLPELVRLYESVMDQRVDRRNFYRKILRTGLLVLLEERTSGVPHKPARYYQFDRSRFEMLKKNSCFSLISRLPETLAAK
ncbi:MAG TPA: NUDIX domain-containing protein [Bacteroidales bacterium]|nr:NUDIX domain-containing protein [Bacteroidales bacterium]